MFCVYVAEIPDLFPVNFIEQQPDKFHEVDFPVSLTGRFFKVRSYRDFGGGVSHSPVVIARQIETDGTTLASMDGTGARPVQGKIYFAFWFAGIAAVATGLAVAVFRAARTHSRQLGQSSAKRMHHSLEMLQQDPSIKSPAQRVAELAGDDGTHSESDMEQEIDQ